MENTWKCLWMHWRFDNNKKSKTIVSRMKCTLVGVVVFGGCQHKIFQVRKMDGGAGVGDKFNWWWLHTHYRKTTELAEPIKLEQSFRMNYPIHGVPQPIFSYTLFSYCWSTHLLVYVYLWRLFSSRYCSFIVSPYIYCINLIYTYNMICTILVVMCISKSADMVMVGDAMLVIVAANGFVLVAPRHWFYLQLTKKNWFWQQ